MVKSKVNTRLALAAAVWVVTLLDETAAHAGLAAAPLVFRYSPELPAPRRVQIVPLRYKISPCAVLPIQASIMAVRVSSVGLAEPPVIFAFSFMVAIFASLALVTVPSEGVPIDSVVPLMTSILLVPDAGATEKVSVVPLTV